MEFLANMFNTKLGVYIIMIGIIVLFVVFLRLLYGPKGLLRKSLWDGIDDDPSDSVNSSVTNASNNIADTKSTNTKVGTKAK